MQAVVLFFYKPDLLKTKYLTGSIPKVKRAENTRTKSTSCNVRAGTKIPYRPNSANTIIVMMVERSRIFPGFDDQKCLLSRKMSTLNWLVKTSKSITNV